MSQGELAVTPGQLTGAGQALVDTADRLDVEVKALSGTEDGDAGANAGFDCGRAAAACEASWQHALQLYGAKLAAAGDTLVVNAENYASTEERNVAGLRPH
jgi:hypothetical protein